MENYRIVKNEQKWYKADQSGANDFKIQVRFLFFFWIDEVEQYTFNVQSYGKIEDAELQILELKKR